MDFFINLYRYETTRKDQEWGCNLSWIDDGERCIKVEWANEDDEQESLETGAWTAQISALYSGQNPLSKWTKLCGPSCTRQPVVQSISNIKILYCFRLSASCPFETVSTIQPSLDIGTPGFWIALKACIFFILVQPDRCAILYSINPLIHL